MATKEEIYDSEIEPLMARILEICKANKIAMFASYSLEKEGDGLLCTSALLPDEYEPPAVFNQIYDLLMHPMRRKPLHYTMRNGDGEVTEMGAIL